MTTSTTTPPQFPISVAYFFDHLANESDLEVTVEEEDFDAARRELIPSVSVEELRHYERVRHAFETVDVSQSNDTSGNRINHSEDEDLASRTKKLSVIASRPETNGGGSNGVSVNGAAGGTNPFRSGSRDKGKGKTKAVPEEWDYRKEFGFGSAVDVDEESDLYSP